MERNIDQYYDFLSLSEHNLHQTDKAYIQLKHCILFFQNYSIYYNIGMF